MYHGLSPSTDPSGRSLARGLHVVGKQISTCSFIKRRKLLSTVVTLPYCYYNLNNLSTFAEGELVYNNVAQKTHDSLVARFHCLYGEVLFSLDWACKVNSTCVVIQGVLLQGFRFANTADGYESFLWICLVSLAVILSATIHFENKINPNIKTATLAEIWQFTRNIPVSTNMFIMTV